LLAPLIYDEIHMMLVRVDLFDVSQRPDLVTHAGRMKLLKVILAMREARFAVALWCIGGIADGGRAALGRSCTWCRVLLSRQQPTRVAAAAAAAAAVEVAAAAAEEVEVVAAAVLSRVS
jgi:hypothetical protein